MCCLGVKIKKQGFALYLICLTTWLEGDSILAEGKEEPEKKGGKERKATGKRKTKIFRDEMKKNED